MRAPLFCGEGSQPPSVSARERACCSVKAFSVVEAGSCRLEHRCRAVTSACCCVNCRRDGCVRWCGRKTEAWHRSWQASSGGPSSETFSGHGREGPGPVIPILVGLRLAGPPLVPTSEVSWLGPREAPYSRMVLVRCSSDGCAQFYTSPHPLLLFRLLCCKLPVKCTCLNKRRQTVCAAFRPLSQRQRPEELLAAAKGRARRFRGDRGPVSWLPSSGRTSESRAFQADVHGGGKARSRAAGVALVVRGAVIDVSGSHSGRHNAHSGSG